MPINLWGYGANGFDILNTPHHVTVITGVAINNNLLPCLPEKETGVYNPARRVYLCVCFSQCLSSDNSQKECCSNSRPLLFELMIGLKCNWETFQNICIMSFVFIKPAQITFSSPWCLTCFFYILWPWKHFPFFFSLSSLNNDYWGLQAAEI